MGNGFCKNCTYLSITEEEQSKLSTNPDHICKKYNVKLYHMKYGVNWHPEIPKCDECKLAYNYIYSSNVRNSFGEVSVIFINPGSWIDGPYREKDMALSNFLPFGFETPYERYMRQNAGRRS